MVRTHRRGPPELKTARLAEKLRLIPGDAGKAPGRLNFRRGNSPWTPCRSEPEF